MSNIADVDIGGARVRRTFTNKGRHMKMGESLTANEVLAVPIANRRALCDAGYIEIFPKSTLDGEKFIVSVGKDRFNVIEGRMINDNPLSREQAETLLRA